MIYKNLTEFIPGLKLSIYEYYIQCYDIQNRILEDPIVVLSNANYTILGFESKTKKNINLTSFAKDTESSKKLFRSLQKSKFYFTIYFNKANPEELFAEDIITTNVHELKGYMKNFLQEKTNKGDDVLWII